MLENIQNGDGLETWPDGAKFEGQYVNGKNCGKKNDWLDLGRWQRVAEEVQKRRKVPDEADHRLRNTAHGLCGVGQF